MKIIFKDSGYPVAKYRAYDAVEDKITDKSIDLSATTSNTDSVRSVVLEVKSLLERVETMPYMDLEIHMQA